MRALTIIGTIAMFMVAGGILSHGIGPLNHLSESAAVAARGIPGIIVLVTVKLVTRLLPRTAKT